MCVLCVVGIARAKVDQFGNLSVFDRRQLVSVTISRSSDKEKVRICKLTM